jgi:hypothetical protein
MPTQLLSFLLLMPHTCTPSLASLTSNNLRSPFFWSGLHCNACASHNDN